MTLQWYIDVSGSLYPIWDLQIDLSLDKLNIATFTSTKKLNKDDSIKIKLNGLELYDSVFPGIVTQIQSNNKGQTYTYTVSEYAVQLNSVYIKSDFRGFFRPKVLIRNPDQFGELLSIKKYLSRILNYQGRGTQYISSAAMSKNTEDLSESATYIPYSDIDGGEPTPLPDFPMSHMTVWTAIDRFIGDILGLYYWYDYSNENPASFKLFYGTRREIRVLDIEPTSRNYMIISTNEANEPQNSTPYGFIVVISNNRNSIGTAGSMYSDKQAAYEIQGNFNQKELNVIAKRILRDKQKNDEIKYTITFPITEMVLWKPGDVIDGLGDKLVSPLMDYRDIDSESPWQIHEMTITEESIRITVGGSYISIFDIYREKLQLVDSIDGTTETVVEKFNDIHVSPTITETTDTEDTELMSSPSSILISDEDTNYTTVTNSLFLDSAATGDISIDFSISDWATSGTDYPYKMKTVQLYDNQTDVALEPNGTYVYEIPYGTTETNKIPCTYNHGDILVQYTIYSTDDADDKFDITWDCWATYDVPAGFENIDIMTASTWIESDNSDVNLSNVTQGTTPIQRFYMQAYPAPRPDDGEGYLPSGKFTFTIKNNLETWATLSNVITKPAILYYEDFGTNDTGAYSFSINDEGYIVSEISGFATISKVIANYLNASKSYYPEEHWNISTAQTELFKEDTTTWKSAIRLSSESEEYWNDNQDDAQYNIQVTGTKCGETPDIDGSVYRLGFGTTPSNKLVIQLFSNSSLYTLDDLLDVISGVVSFGISANFDDQGIAYINYSDIPTVYKSESDFYTNPGKYTTLTFTQDPDSICETASTDQALIYVKINSYDEWIPVYEDQPLKFNEDFEFPTNGLVASSDIWNYGLKLANRIRAKSYSGDYNVSMNISYTKYKGYYVDLDDQVGNNVDD